MRFLVDECIFIQVVDHLRRGGHDVVWIGDLMPSVEDKAVLEAANAERRILMSEDRDFGELIFRDGMPAVAIISLRVSEFDFAPDEMGRYAAAKVLELGDRLLGQFTVIEPGGERPRPLPRIVAC
jgi:predicted nuclease of predicted toxin-antitoxin system